MADSSDLQLRRHVPRVVWPPWLPLMLVVGMSAVAVIAGQWCVCLFIVAGESRVCCSHSIHDKVGLISGADPPIVMCLVDWRLLLCSARRQREWALSCVVQCLGVGFVLCGSVFGSIDNSHMLNQ